METDNALPVAEQPAASVQPVAETPAESTEGAQDAPETKPEGEEKPKPEKTFEQRQIERQARKIDRLVKQREELRARLEQGGLQARQIGDTNGAQADDTEKLSLSQAELQELIDKRAREIAPVIKEQQAAIEHRRKVVDGLAKDWGQEKFDALASDLDEAFDGLADRSGQPKPATDAIFESDDPKALIEYLADPEHADEAEAIAQMDALRAGRAIAKLEAKLAQAKPQPSKAPPPLEPVKGRGELDPDPSRMTDAEFAAWRRRQIAQRR